MMEDLEIEFAENDGFVNAKHFKIMRGIFDNAKDRKKFNLKCDELRDKILTIAVGISDNAQQYEKFNDLTEKRQKSLVKKAEKTKLFINKTKNRYKFTDWCKQVIINLVYANIEGK